MVRTRGVCRLLSGPVVAAVAILVLGSGCASLKHWQGKDEVAKFGEGVPSAPLPMSVTGADKNAVVQASATMPMDNPVSGPSLSKQMNNPASPSTFAKMTGMAAKPEKKIAAAEIVVLWRNKIDFLPDPTRNGAMGAGLAGQLFLFGPGMQSAPAEGKLTVALYDETPRQPGQPQNQPEVWEFSKETLRGLRTPDERFGMCYALFLPWPAYRPDVSRIRIAARFEPEKGDTLYPPETRITIDTSGPGNAGSWASQPFVPNAQPQPMSGPNLLGGPPPASGPGFGVMTPPPAPPTAPLGTLPLAPVSYGSLAPTNPVPAQPQVDTSNLPPLAITIPRRQ
ncbi:MAG: hypothetical protein K8U57_13435 [Planctomycetes bacterium]|nr:hypothetical protein [Planctomycetota bacterium]